MADEKLQIDFLPETKSIPTPWFTYFCGLTASTMVMSLGISIAWFSPVISKLTSNDTDINPLGEPISTLQVSLIPVLLYFSTALTYPLWAKVVDRIGRRTTLRLLALIIIFSLFMTAFANHFYIYLVTLPITGAGVSGSLLSASLYVNEISEDSYRGTLGCIVGIQIPLGLLYGFICGALANVRVFTLLCAVPSIIHLILSQFIPESPVYLIANNKDVDAVAALKKLRRTTDSSVIDMQCSAIKEIVQATASLKQKSVFDIFRNRNARKAFFLSTQLFVFEQLSGISIILAYVVPIIDSSQSTLNGNAVSVLIGVVKVLTYLISLYLIDRIGRRKLILTSSFFCIFPIFFMGIYSYLAYKKSHAFDNLGWLLVVFVIFYVISYSIGLGTVPITFAGEIFPDDLRAVGVSLVLGIDQILACTESFSYPNLAELWGAHWCFWFCSFVTIVGFINMYFTVPETKGKSFAEIQKMLSE